MILDRQQLETFAVIVELRHFGKAADALKITRGAVSQRLIALEETVGVPLLVREGAVPTPAGEAVLRHIRQLRLLEADTVQRIKPDGSIRAVISVAVNADSLATWFEPVAHSIARGNFALELIADDQDHTLLVLERGGAIGCVSTASIAPTGFVAVPIGAMEYECVAHPTFAKKYFPHGLVLHDILAAPAVLFNRKDGLHALFLQSLVGFPVGGYVTHFFPSPSALLAAIIERVGYGLVPSMQVSTLINAGKLVSLAPKNKIMVELYWHHWEKAPENVRTLSDLVIRYAKKALVAVSRQDALPESSQDSEAS